MLKMKLPKEDDFGNVPEIVVLKSAFPEDGAPSSFMPHPVATPLTHVLRDLPSNTPYTGQYGFEIFFSEAKEKNANKKAIPFIYSADTNKLFVRLNETCPVHFKLAQLPPMPVYIRAMAIYGKPQDLADVVKRCMTHIDKDKDIPEPRRSHFVRCTNAEAVYMENSDSGRQSVLVTYQPPDYGANSTTVYYQFTCFSSCCGSINRRPVQLIFTLESRNQVVGRQVVDLRVCSCPGRDKSNEESSTPKRKHEQVDHVTTITSSESAPKQLRQPASPADDDSEMFTIQVRGRELYKLLQTIVRNFEIARNVSQLVALKSSTPNQNIVPTMTSFSSSNQNNAATAQTSSSLAGKLDENNCEPKRQNLNNRRCLSPHKNLEQLVGRLSQEKKILGSCQIASWLDTLNLSRYAPKFQEQQLYIMDHLKNLSGEKLRELGVKDQKDYDKLYESLIRWRLTNGITSSSQTNSLATPTSPVKGLQISRTTIKHSYKFKPRD